ncbi:MAG: hypothetical protein ACRDSH_03370 [Pseudonocardiaceae bacterium]
MRITRSIHVNPQPRRRWPWVASLLLGIMGIMGIAGAIARGRWRRQPERFGHHQVDHLMSGYRDQVVSGRSPTANGVVRVEGRPSGTD